MLYPVNIRGAELPLADHSLRLVEILWVTFRVGALEDSVGIIQPSGPALEPPNA